MKRISIVFLLLCMVVLGIAACNNNGNTGNSKGNMNGDKVDLTDKTNNSPQDSEHSPSPVDSELEHQDLQDDAPDQAAMTIVNALERHDMEEISHYTDKEEGLRFSPYPYIDKTQDLVFMPEQVKGLMEDSTVRVWGVAAGSGEPIELPYAQYHDQFVYDAGFGQPSMVKVDQLSDKSTMNSNWKDIYPADKYVLVNHFVEGTQENEGMDWSSLAVVFKKEEGKLRLVALIHDEWTP